MTSSQNPKTPYADLDPVLILDAIEQAGFFPSGSLIALNSFENRVYQIGMEEGEPLIAKFYRPNRWSDAAIREEHQFSLELQAHEIPVIAPLVENGETLHEFKHFRFALFPRKAGHAFEMENLHQLEMMGRLIGRMHAVSATKRFQHRIQLTSQTYGRDSYQFLVNNKFIPDYLAEKYKQTVESLLTKIEARFKQAENVTYIRLHGDCHAGNILWRNDSFNVVDLDDCLMGPAIQDLWMLLSGNDHDRKIQLDRLLDGYCEFHDYNPREIYLIEALRALRMLHYAGWLAKRWDDPAFPLNFPWFNTPRYWEDQLQDLSEQDSLL